MAGIATTMEMGQMYNNPNVMCGKCSNCFLDGEIVLLMNSGEICHSGCKSMMPKIRGFVQLVPIGTVLFNTHLLMYNNINLRCKKCCNHFMDSEIVTLTITGSVCHRACLGMMSIISKFVQLIQSNNK